MKQLAEAVGVDERSSCCGRKAGRYRTKFIASKNAYGVHDIDEIVGRCVTRYDLIYEHKLTDLHTLATSTP